MRDISNWDEIQEQNDGEFGSPKPGGYIARIVHVEDKEDKEYLQIEWDFEDGEFKGNNQDTYDRAGFWPIRLIRSYKPKALGFFKGFKTCVEVSNPGYVFDTKNVQGLVGKLFGVVVGEEEYKKNNGAVGRRLYVSATRSVKSIRDKDFTVPELKKLPIQSGTDLPKFSEIEDDGELPF